MFHHKSNIKTFNIFSLIDATPGEYRLAEKRSYENPNVHSPDDALNEWNILRK